MTKPLKVAHDAEGMPTDGPWKAEGAYVFAGKDCIGICDTDNASAETMFANAKLMAQAPALKDFAWRAAAMLRFLKEHDGECLGDHPSWIERIDQILATKLDK